MYMKVNNSIKYIYKGEKMTKEIEKIYLDFFEYYETVKEKLEVIYNNCEYVDSLFEGIITSLKYYYDNKSEIILSDDVIDYFEHEDFLNSIINKIKYTIEFLDLVYYKILNEDVNLFNDYIIVIYYISILEDLLMFVESKNMDSTWVEDELKELNDILYNKVEITESYSEYISNKITEISKTYDGFYPSIIIFKIVKTLISDQTPNKEEFIEGAIQDFLNNMGSYEELFKLIEKEDMSLYNRLLKLESVILKIIFAKRDKQVIFDENNEDVVDALIIELTNYYNIYLSELHRIYDLFGIEYLIKYKDLIYYASLVKDIIESFGDIVENDEGLGDYFIACYESILENNMDDFEQFVLYGVDLLDDLCEHHEIAINKLEEEIEFLYSVLLKSK